MVVQQRAGADVLSHFWGLASLNAEERLTAATSLVDALAAAQTRMETSVRSTPFEPRPSLQYARLPLALGPAVLPSISARTLFARQLVRKMLRWALAAECCPDV